MSSFTPPRKNQRHVRLHASPSVAAFRGGQKKSWLHSYKSSIPHIKQEQETNGYEHHDDLREHLNCFN